MLCLLALGIQLGVPKSMRVAYIVDNTSVISFMVATAVFHSRPPLSAGRERISEWTFILG
jgi:hypothetical protein